MSTPKTEEQTLRRAAVLATGQDGKLFTYAGLLAGGGGFFAGSLMLGHGVPSPGGVIVGVLSMVAFVVMVLVREGKIRRRLARWGANGVKRSA